MGNDSFKPGQLIPVEKCRWFELKPGDQFIFFNEVLKSPNQIKKFYGQSSYISKGKTPEPMPKGTINVWKLL